MITAPAAYFPGHLVAIGLTLLWLWSLVVLKPSPFKDMVYTFGVGFILSTFLVGVLVGADEPVARLNDSASSWRHGTPVYDFVDPVTHRRFLVVYTPNGVAMAEATPAPVQAPAPATPVLKPDTTHPWEETTTGAPLDGRARELGWETWKTEVLNGRYVYFVRRKNPNYIEPAGPEQETSPLQSAGK